jgi:hypothetical protein
MTDITRLRKTLTYKTFGYVIKWAKIFGGSVHLCCVKNAVYLEVQNQVFKYRSRVQVSEWILNPS